MSWQVDVAGGVKKYLTRIPQKDSLRIKTALRELAQNPYTGDIEKLKGDLVWRRRVGSYRIFFEIYESIRAVRVYGVERRGSNTY